MVFIFVSGSNHLIVNNRIIILNESVTIIRQLTTSFLVILEVLATFVFFINWWKPSHISGSKSYEHCWGNCVFYIFYFIAFYAVKRERCMIRIHRIFVAVSLSVSPSVCLSVKLFYKFIKCTCDVTATLSFAILFSKKPRDLFVPQSLIWKCSNGALNYFMGFLIFPDY